MRCSVVAVFLQQHVKADGLKFGLEPFAVEILRHLVLVSFPAIHDGVVRGFSAIAQEHLFRRVDGNLLLNFLEQGIFSNLQHALKSLKNREWWTHLPQLRSFEVILESIKFQMYAAVWDKLVACVLLYLCPESKTQFREPNGKAIRP